MASGSGKWAKYNKAVRGSSNAKSRRKKYDTGPIADENGNLLF